MKRFNIDLSKVSGYIEGEEDRKIRGQLIKHGLYNQNCLYSVFNGDRIKQVERTGNYRKENPDSIFAFTKNEFGWETEELSNNHIKDLIRDYDNPAIAIYDKSQFFQDYEKGDYRWEYFFKNPDKKLEALLGIAFLEFGKPDF